MPEQRDHGNLITSVIRPLSVYTVGVLKTLIKVVEISIWLGLYIVLMITSIDLSHAVLAIDLLTALKSPLGQAKR